MKAKIVSPSSSTFDTAAQRLQNNDLVAFPTETVYGLGANALSEHAVEKIFAAKGRPKTDPLIVHVCAVEEALALTRLSTSETLIFRYLAAAFWPGPLTIVATAGAQIPKNVTGGGDAVGLRSPAHPVAQELLKAAKRPVAAPSANRFGHVSPTTAQHVYDDLNDADVLIVDGGPTSVGVESTVVKILNESALVVLRPGFVTKTQIEECLQKNGFSSVAVTSRSAVVSETEMQSAPGQLLTHYAPRLECFLWTKGCSFEALSQKVDVAKTVLIDFAQTNVAVSKNFLRYYDLSQEGSVVHASQNLFLFLREAEIIVGAKTILIADVKIDNERWAAVYDRMFRAASGKVLI